MGLVFRQLFDAPSSTYSYLLGDGAAGEAVIVDPVFEHARRDAALLRELGLRLVATLDTHVHASRWPRRPARATPTGCCATATASISAHAGSRCARRRGTPTAA